ncbi:MAG: hypothetical protein EBS05_03465 [Proteobacteria bacterium]|nr:hypothetical protein [Pseudomonadota bacterium]
MNPTLPPEIRVEPGAHSTRYLLPPRETGPLKVMAVFLIGFGCVFAGFAGFWMLGVLGMTQGGGFQIGGALLALFGLPFLAAGLSVIGLGVFALCGRCEIEVHPGELIACERGGPFWWTRRISLKDIRCFTLASDALRVNGQPVTAGPLSDVGFLGAEVGAAKPRVVLLGYPRVWTEALAARLTADLASLTGVAPLPTTVMQRNLVTGTKAVAADVYDPPAGTKVRIMEQAGGLVVVIPRSGFKGASRLMLGFAACWLIISIVVAAGFIGAALDGRSSRPPWFAFLFVGVFVLIGLGMLANAVNLAFRKASIRASRDELIIVQQSFLGTKTFKRTRSELAAIRVGDSGVEINHVPVQEIQVHTLYQQQHGFCSNLSIDELLWLATRLRDATGLVETAGESCEPPILAK